MGYMGEFLGIKKIINGRKDEGNFFKSLFLPVMAIRGEVGGGFYFFAIYN